MYKRISAVDGLRIIQTASRQASLGHSDKLVLILLALRCNRDWKCWPSITRIAADCWMSESGVKACTKRLRALGWISISYKYISKNRRTTNTYTVHVDRIASSYEQPLLSVSVRTPWDAARERAQSPIEIGLINSLEKIFIRAPTEDGSVASAISDDNGFVTEHNLFTQHKVGKFFIDIAITSDNGNKYAIELDGHEFHERTKEQARRDKSRDRFLVSEGWRVLRFTGSEIYNGPDSCAQEIVSIIGKLS